MQPSEELPWALKAELCRVRKTFRDLAEDLGVGQTYLSMVVHGQKRAYDVIDAIGKPFRRAFRNRSSRRGSPRAQCACPRRS